MAEGFDCCLYLQFPGPVLNLWQHSCSFLSFSGLLMESIQDGNPSGPDFVHISLFIWKSTLYHTTVLIRTGPICISWQIFSAVLETASLATLSTNWCRTAWIASTPDSHLVVDKAFSVKFLMDDRLIFLELRSGVQPMITASFFFFFAVSTFSTISILLTDLSSLH